LKIGKYQTAEGIVCSPEVDAVRYGSIQRKYVGIEEKALDYKRVASFSTSQKTESASMHDSVVRSIISPGKRFLPMGFTSSISTSTRWDSRNRGSHKIKASNVFDQRRVFSARKIWPKAALQQYKPRNSVDTKIISVTSGTKPGPQWCPAGLTHTQKRRVQRLRALEIMEKITEKKCDKWFSRDRPMVPPNMTWKVKLIIIDENRNVDDTIVAQNSKNSRDAYPDGDVIKKDNPSCITLTEASVDLQHGEILCLTDATVKWRQRFFFDKERFIT
jgi:hypothetical protein